MLLARSMPKCALHVKRNFCGLFREVRQGQQKPARQVPGGLGEVVGKLRVVAGLPAFRLR